MNDHIISAYLDDIDERQDEEGRARFDGVMDVLNGYNWTLRKIAESKGGLLTLCLKWQPNETYAQHLSFGSHKNLLDLYSEWCDLVEPILATQPDQNRLADLINYEIDDRLKNQRIENENDN